MTARQYEAKGRKYWEYTFTYTDGSGKRRFKRGKKFRTKADAERAEVEMRFKLNAGEVIAHGEGTVGDFLDLWVTRLEASGSLKPTTLHSYANDLRIYVVPRIGSLPLRKLTPLAISKLYADLLATGRVNRTAGKASGLSAKSVRNIGGTLHKALSDGVRWGLFPSNPCDKVDLPRWDRREPKGWDEVETGRFLAHLHNCDPVLYALYRLAFNASLRRGELLGLRWTDIDLLSNAVTIVQTRTVVDGRIIVGTPKSRRSRRTERIDAETANALARLKDLQEQAAANAGGNWHSEYVATDLLGKPFHPLTFTRTFLRYGKELGLPRINMHEVRHTSVFIGELSGVGITTLSGRLGHADPGFTLRTYSPYLKSADALSAEAIGRTFDQSMRLAQLDTTRYKLDTELHETTETKGVDAAQNPPNTELNASTVKETVEATPGIEPSGKPYEIDLWWTF